MDIQPHFFSLSLVNKSEYDYDKDKNPKFRNPLHKLILSWSIPECSSISFFHFSFNSFHQFWWNSNSPCPSFLHSLWWKHQGDLEIITQVSPTVSRVTSDTWLHRDFRQHIQGSLPKGKIHSHCPFHFIPLFQMLSFQRKENYQYSSTVILVFVSNLAWSVSQDLELRPITLRLSW